MAALQEVSDYFLEHCYVDRSSHPNNSKKVNEHIFWNADLSLCNLDLVIKPKYDVFFLPKYLVFGSLKAPDSTFKDSYRMRNLMITWSDVIWFTAATCWLWITHCTTKATQYCRLLLINTHIAWINSSMYLQTYCWETSQVGDENMNLWRDELSETPVSPKANRK